MRHHKTGDKKRRFGITNFAALIAGAGAIALIVGANGCATTTQEQPNIIAKVQGAPNPVPAFSGFLGDYTLLSPGGEGQALYRYINPSVNWAQYKYIIIDPVQFWGGQESSVSPEDQQALCEYFYNKLREDLSKGLVITDQPGPGVMRLQVAITDATAATPVLRTVSVVVPQARLLSKVTQLATGSYAFVGSARGEMKLTDSVSGQILAEAMDQRMGGNAVRTAGTWQWQDAERVMDQWCQTLDDRITQLRTTGTITTASN